MIDQVLGCVVVIGLVKAKAYTIKRLKGAQVYVHVVHVAIPSIATRFVNKGTKHHIGTSVRNS